MPFESAITMILAALAALLTALAIIIGMAALWGWAGIKDGAEKAATNAMNLKMCPHVIFESSVAHVNTQRVMHATEVVVNEVKRNCVP
jgi:hypothetical protein